MNDDCIFTSAGDDEAAMYDYEAIAWAYGKCVALGLENSSAESAEMMDRLKMILGGFGDDHQT